MSEYVLPITAIVWPILMIVCAAAILWCGRTARQNAAPQVSTLSDACRTPGRSEPEVAAPLPDPWSCWIPHKEGADRNEEINAYISAFIAGDQAALRGAGMDGTSEKQTAFESQRSSPASDLERELNAAWNDAIRAAADALWPDDWDSIATAESQRDAILQLLRPGKSK